MFNNKIQATFLKYIIYEMPLYLHLLFYFIGHFRLIHSVADTVGLFRLIHPVADTVVTFALSSILNLHFLLVVLLITLMSGDISENPGPSSHSSTNNISLSVMHLNIRSIRKKN